MKLKYCLYIKKQYAIIKARFKIGLYTIVDDSSGEINEKTVKYNCQMDNKT